ncbi:hypothetical protein BS50DRAFT_588169 [Corynespora cassiicola Philippines]|uniref:G-protein coupled receptors family 2 profile 2 domain-containing protein n=1 Tax=Corynespora cassiicola Philippines TaxID=1448308 RepID=A0A2T2NP03_CORCC|nr:hypothetical protein BS50DRAFT_588169 [Corynespora cassiicola Philippines]
MPLGRFANETISACTAPLLDESLFGKTGGHQEGRYCGLGSFEGGTTCCFPCPIQDYLYSASWRSQLRVPNYLSILSVILCLFLLLSFAVLPAEQTHRHYLSVGLLFPVLFISLSFMIPVAVNPSLCYDDITPHDMRSSMSCAWTGSLVTLGGLGCVIWVFLRSLWLHIRICWDRDPGKKFKWGSILAGTFLPLIFLASIVTATGFSYRMGQTCLPNHENAIVTFWIWLVLFAVAGFLLQAVTTSYCVYVYMRTLSREQRNPVSVNSFQRNLANYNHETWTNVKRLFLLQWRNILVSIFVIIGTISFLIVFWTQDSKLGRVFNDPENIKPVKTWIICQTLSRGDKDECRKYVDGFTVNRASVVTSLILASLVGIEIFILLFRLSMLQAWCDLFKRLTSRAHNRRNDRTGSLQLTSLENPEKYLGRSLSKRLPFFSTLKPSSTTDENAAGHTSFQNSGGGGGGGGSFANRDKISTAGSNTHHESSASDTNLLHPPPIYRNVLEDYSISPVVSRAETSETHDSGISFYNDVSPPQSLPPSRLSFTPSRGAPSPPPKTSWGRMSDSFSLGTSRPKEYKEEKRSSDLGVLGTFKHVDGAYHPDRSVGLQEVTEYGI